jgi:hypothetical protein
MLGLRGMMLSAAALFGASALAGAASAATFTVDAINPISSWLDTGLILAPGTTYDFSVINPATIWSAGSNSPASRDSTADGIPLSRGYGQWSEFGLTANYGALVGEDATHFFLIGTGTALSGLSGDLKVGYWDSFYPDNSGSQTLSVGVPEPATWAMLLIGFSGLGAALRARRKVALATAA